MPDHPETPSESRKKTASAAQPRRPSMDEYFMRIAHLVGTRTTCLRRAVGAVIVKEKHILSTGYNGAPAGMRHCIETGCLREKHGVPSGEKHELCRGVHAEQNAIIQAAAFGTPVRGSSMYSTTYPCTICAKMIINAGIKEVVFDVDYEDELSRSIFEESGIRLRRIVMSEK